MTATNAAPTRARSRSKGTRSAEALVRDAEARAAAKQKLTVVPDPPAPPPPLDIMAKLGGALGHSVAGPPVPPAPEAAAPPVGQKPQPKAIEPPPAKTGKNRAPAAPKPETAKTKPAAPAPAKDAAPGAGVMSKDRYIGTVTGADGKVHDCEHAGRNGHITEVAALSCAQRLTRNHAGQVGTRIRLRYWGAGKTTGGVVSCGCRFGHKTEDAARGCASRLGLRP